MLVSSSSECLQLFLHFLYIYFDIIKSVYLITVYLTVLSVTQRLYGAYDPMRVNHEPKSMYRWP